MKLLKILFVHLIIYIFVVTFKNPEKVVKSNYEVKGYQDLKDATNFTEGGIPKIIVKTSWQKRDSFPIQIQDVLDKTKELNPDYDLYYFDNDEMDEFVKDFSPEVEKCFKKLKPGAFKADLFRYCFLYKYGGCYSDIGHVMKVSFDEICQNHSLVLVRDSPILFKVKVWDWGIHNALMCSVKNHILFKKCIKQCCDNISNNFYGEGPLEITGPKMIGKIFDQHNFSTRLLYPSMSYSIYDEKNQELLKTKFKDYYDVMYRDGNKKRYPIMWLEGDIYQIN